MPKTAILTTTALVVCMSAAFAGQLSDTRIDANAQFLSWYGGAMIARAAARDLQPPGGSKLLYGQNSISGYSSYAVSTTNFFSSSGYCCYGNIAADDFTIPGTGTHRITAVSAAGVASGEIFGAWTITFYDKLKYYKNIGITTAKAKSTCNSSSYSMTGGDVLVDVSSCKLGKFRGGHDYAVSVQFTPYIGGGSWAWQTNRNQVGRQAFYFTYGLSGSCLVQLLPIKTCLPGAGYGPDLAFAVFGK